MNIKTIGLTLSLAILATAVSSLRAQEAGRDAAKPAPTPGDAVLDRLDACGLDLVACVQGAVRAGTPLRIGGCRRAFQACRQAPPAQDAGPVVECRQECMKDWNRCRRDATPAFLEAKKVCVDRARACGAGNRACWRQAAACPESRRELDACIDARQRCEDHCAAAGAALAAAQ